MPDSDSPSEAPLSSKSSAATSLLSGWLDTALVNIEPKDREAHVRYCSYFADNTLDRYPQWLDGLDRHRPPRAELLETEIARAGLDSGLRRFRNHQMLRIIWRDLCGLSTLAETFSDLTTLAGLCLQAAVEAHSCRLQEKYGKPRDEDGSEQQLFVIAMGKFGGGELNLSSDIDVVFCYPRTGVCDGQRQLANDQYFTRVAQAVIASLAEVAEEGFCFRVDTRLRPFGDSGPLVSSIAAMEQYYQREGRDWERYALIKARPVAGDLESGERLLKKLQPFIYRRYIDFGSVEALQDMHMNVQEDAKKKDRLDDIKRGPGGIREIEFLVQCFQILRGGREPVLQTPSLDRALEQIVALGLMSHEAVVEMRRDYVFLRRLENRIQALRDQQTHRLPPGEDLGRIAQGMGEKNADTLSSHLSTIRQRVSERFEAIFPSRPAPKEDSRWNRAWLQLQNDRQGIDPPNATASNDPISVFLRRLDRLVLSHRARRRLDRFMPLLLERINRQSPDPEIQHRIFDLVLAVCRRSAYLVLLVQHVPALDRMLELFARSEWVADRVIRFPALLDELIDPSLGRQIPDEAELADSVERLVSASQGAETMLEGLNHLKLASSLHIAVAQLHGSLLAEQAQHALSGLAASILGGVLTIAGKELERRHGRFASPGVEDGGMTPGYGQLAVIAYGSLGAEELGYDSDLDLVFLFMAGKELSDGARPLPAERYYARLAQRVLSLLTIMTPSGRLYEVDTRLRPNGRAGSLVSSMGAFEKYQVKEAWTWELQALTRARFVAGSRALSAHLDGIRQQVLCRPGDAEKLRTDLLTMRQKMLGEQNKKDLDDLDLSAKHQPGGLIDIEFIAQLGILVSAPSFPHVMKATGTLSQLSRLEAIGWLTQNEARVLKKTASKLWQQRMNTSLMPAERLAAVDTRESTRVFEQKLGACVVQGEH